MFFFGWVQMATRQSYFGYVKFTFSDNWSEKYDESMSEWLFKEICLNIRTYKTIAKQKTGKLPQINT